MTLSENDIRPRDFDELRFAAQRKDIEWLLARSSAFVVVPCPACGSLGSSPKFSKHGFVWDECIGCRSAFVKRRPSPATLSEFYSQSELYKVWDKHIFPSSSAVRRERIFKPRLQQTLALLDRLGVPFSSLFEIGAAHGIFCDEARKSGRFSRVVAIEPSGVQAETCRRLGIETIETTIEDLAGHDGAADVVAAFEVVEHLSDPLGFVRSARKLLQPKGLLVLSTPNVQGFELLTLGERSDSVYPEHVTLFSPDGMAKMIEKAGLDVLEFTTPGVLDCDIVRNKALAGVIDLNGQPFLKRHLIDEWELRGSALQSYISASRQSSHMWFVAQRSA